ncbi:5'-AMP-activated protein kinase subunit beta-1-like isoform X1 [Saccostrea echinata]|uniref:5'-AMP-activated protein kinase subunit beta-1-like isoform X1 n=1 Tax=Saccostrea echinata TaxID=191078 RepID=UPI002A82D925|nr:5'-AMP-activated protein kinase subunit beta-1-like isoform X1 [Saccostrea echinata]
MGNSSSSSSRSRHISGDETGPSLTAGKFLSDSSCSQDNYEALLKSGYRRQRAATTQSQGDTSIMKPKLLPTVFKWEGGGKDVYITGSFNNWQSKIPLVKSSHDGEFLTIIDLPEGDYQYRFCVDGNMCVDPNEPTVTNDKGTQNNVISVKKSDFEVFEALALDSLNTNSNKKGLDTPGSPSGEYCQDVPPRKPGEKHSGPPILPPHLLQVILNKDTPAHCEPTLLPEPNHVMLNHLYALSIKDGVMVLSATHRFRKKYVTTLLYKPI